MKPTIIYVSGAPGSGKTTLARILSEQLYIPHISSDMIQGGLEFTQFNHDRKSAIGLVFVPLLIDQAKRGISFVVDHVLQRDIAKATIVDRLQEHANVIYVHVQASNPIDRYITRVKTSELPDIVRRRELLIERASYHKKNLINTADPIELGVPTIVVNTNDGYEPALNEIIAFINSYKIKAD